MGSINAYGALLVAPKAEIRRRRQARRTIWVDYQRIIVNQLAAVWRDVSLTKICRDDILGDPTLFSRRVFRRFWLFWVRDDNLRHPTVFSQRKWMLLPPVSQLLIQKPSLRSSLPASLGPSHVLVTGALPQTPPLRPSNPLALPSRPPLAPEGAGGHGFLTQKLSRPPAKAIPTINNNS